MVVRTKSGELAAHELKRKTAKSIELKSLNTQHGDRTLPTADVVWIARILDEPISRGGHADRANAPSIIAIVSVMP